MLGCGRRVIFVRLCLRLQTENQTPIPTLRLTGEIAYTHRTFLSLPLQLYARQQSGIITGSAVALLCCKAHAKINRKMGNSTPYKIVTPENIILKLCIRDYVGEMTHQANFAVLYV